jgi:hypothetical protein
MKAACLGAIGCGPLAGALAVNQKAKKLYAAIADKPDGVMQWIRAHW